MGQYGTFEMEISADDGTMTWTSDLENLDNLAEELGLEPFPSLNYHLHQSWTNTETNYAVGGDGCGPAVTGGHYDPFFGVRSYNPLYCRVLTLHFSFQCGPASGIPAEMCLAIDKERTAERYTCSTAYAVSDYSACEVGDLSGKDGGLVVESDGSAFGASLLDPLAAQNNHFVAGTSANPADRFASIVYHDGSPRVLCARLFLADDAPAVSPTSACAASSFELWNTELVDENFGDSGATICNSAYPEGYNIRAIASGCDEVSLHLTGADSTSRTERAAPYFLFGDNSGAPSLRNLAPGSYMLEAEGSAIMFDVTEQC